MSIPLAEVLAERRAAGTGSLLVYLMVDKTRLPLVGRLARICRDAGVTGLELGFPFSDPIADGPVLQAAAVRALAHRTHWSDLLSALDAATRELPCAVMTYANPVFRRGIGDACRDVRRHGGSALIVPDLPWDESASWQAAARSAGLALVQMASPATSVARVGALARSSEAFLYLVSRYGTTGRGSLAGTGELAPLVRAAHRARPELPVLVGFGIRAAADMTDVRRAQADGAVVGSAFEERLSRTSATGALHRFLAPLARAAA
jgi:tryptophan synthase alpha chain